MHKEKPKILALAMAYTISVSVWIVSQVIIGIIDNVIWNLTIPYIFDDLISTPIHFGIYHLIKQQDGLKNVRDNDRKSLKILLPIGVVVLTTTTLFRTTIVNDLLLIALLGVVVPLFGFAIIYQLKKYYSRLAYDNEIKTAIWSLENYKKIFLSDWAQNGNTKTAEIYNSYANNFEEIIENFAVLSNQYDRKSLATLKTDFSSISEIDNLIKGDILLNGCEMLRHVASGNMEFVAELFDIIQTCADKNILFVCDGLVDKNLLDKVDNLFKSAMLDSLKNSIYKLDSSQVKYIFDRKLSLKFMENDGTLTFKVSDNANDFPVKIFSKLRRKSVRTNVDIDKAA
ncbi:MAG: hypothetical protein FWE04_03635 [Oscillospiraceae bacterium]|nr:hypothetical protein [Oscillospiraceae bacterium]